MSQFEVREIRVNPIFPGESVLVATARNLRPKKAEQPVQRDTRDYVETCPFCCGNEAMTPPAIMQLEKDGAWQVRIVENLYPVVAEDSSRSTFSFGMQQIIDGYGRHEVIVDHPQHGIALHEMDRDHIRLIFTAYRDRMQQLYENNLRFKYILVFKNFGPAAGASIVHTHSQLIALPIVPENVFIEAEHSRRYFKKNHHCIFCSLIDEALTFEATIYDRTTEAVRREIKVKQYVVERGEEFIAIKPFASRHEWEVHLYPLHHQADFINIGDAALADFARVLKRTMMRLNKVLGGVQYNYFLHSTPHDESLSANQSSYHWHLEICPRTTIPTGFELGSGLYVNTISPEQVAHELRAVCLGDEATEE